MEIRFYGHACIFVRTENYSLAIDPWFSRTGAFLYSWFQFPDNRDLDLTPVQNSDFIVISHEHQDHMDLKFLKTISPKTKIIIPKYSDSYLYDSLRTNLKNEIWILNSREKIQICPEIRLCLVIQSVPIWDDCSIIVETVEGTILDLNDMKITGSDLNWIKQHFQVKYLFMQFAPSAWHPYVYDYDDGKKSSIIRRKTFTRFSYAKDTFLASGAERMIPSAGPPCFLDDDLFQDTFLDECVFSALPEFYKFAVKEGFAGNLCLLLPGETLLPDGEYGESNQRTLQQDPYANTRLYLSRYKQSVDSLIRAELEEIVWPEQSLLQKCKQHFEPLISSSPHFRKKINGKLLLDITGSIDERILIDFSRELNQVKLYDDEKDVSWVFRMEARFLNLIFENKLTWEEMLLSRRVKAARDPDVYNEYLIFFLRFRDANSFSAYQLWEERNSQQESFYLHYENRQYRVQKYCPHARADLSKARIIDGELVCPGHGWTFSLKDGTCKQNDCSITVEQPMEPV